MYCIALIIYLIVGAARLCSTNPPPPPTGRFMTRYIVMCLRHCSHAVSPVKYIKDIYQRVNVVLWSWKKPLLFIMPSFLNTL